MSPHKAIVYYTCINVPPPKGMGGGGQGHIVFCVTLLHQRGGGHIVFGADSTGIGVGMCLCDIS